MGFYRGPKIVTDGLVLYLDAANVRSYPGTGTTWNNLVGSNNAVVPSTSIQGAIKLSSQDITLSHNTLFDTLFNGSFTIETSVKSTDDVYPRSYHPLAIQSTVTSSTDRGMSFGHNQSKTQMQIRTSDGVNIQVTTLPQTPVTTNTTYHRTFVVTKTTGFSIKYYLDGVLQGTANHSAITGNIYSANGMYFGNVFGWRFIGEAYYIKVYNNALSDETVLQNYNATKSRYNL